MLKEATHTILNRKEISEAYLTAPDYAENVNPVVTMIIPKGQRQQSKFGDNLLPGSIVRIAPQRSMKTDLFIDFTKHLGKYKTQVNNFLFDGSSFPLDYFIVQEAERPNIATDFQVTQSLSFNYLISPYINHLSIIWIKNL